MKIKQGVYFSVSDDPTWDVVCDTEGLPIDEQVDAVVDRLRGREASIRRLVDEGATATLQIVRHFEAEDGEEESIEPPEGAPDGVTKLGGQHQLLGWHLDSSVIAFLAETGTEVDADEYG